MMHYIIYGITLVVTVALFWRNRKNIEDSFKQGETGFSARKLIAFQLMAAVLAGDGVFVWILSRETPWAQKYFGEWENTHLLYVMFVLGFLSVPEIIKLIETIKGKIEVRKDDTNNTNSNPS